MSLSRLLKSSTAACLYRSGALSLHRSFLERGRGIVLMYHRVNDHTDPFFPSLPVSVFAQQLDYLVRHYRVEPLESVVEWVTSGAAGKPRVALTIDDGYPDTFECMMPELAKRGLSATLFLSTSPVETGDVLWTERLRWAFKHATRARVDLSAVGLGLSELGAVQERLPLLRRLLSGLKERQPSVIEEVSSRLAHELRPDGPLPRTLTWDRVKEMSESGCFAVGAHTHRHYLLSRLDDAELEREIRTSAELIRSRLARPVRLFCYPNGRSRDYDARSFPILRSLGVRYAVSAESGFVRPASPPLELPRIYTSEKSLPLFAARLAGIGGLSRMGGREESSLSRSNGRLEARG
ncbi:MAG: polysaccharide deacetylase family protein [Vicinamibacteria bacterium]